MELIFSHCSLVYSFIFCNFVFQPFLFLTLFPFCHFFFSFQSCRLSFHFSPLSSIWLFFFFFVLLGTLPSSSLCRPFLYPHSLFFPTALKKPNGETSAFSKNFLTKKTDDKQVMLFCTAKQSETEEPALTLNNLKQPVAIKGKFFTSSFHPTDDGVELRSV